MRNKAVRLWLKTWPKLLVAICGLTVYLLSEWIPKDHQPLAQSIAVNLISIPIIFILYDIWNDKSHRQLYEHVYDYAGNEMSIAMSAAKKEMESLVYGLYGLLDNTGLIVDDSDFTYMKVKLRDDCRVETDEDEEKYIIGSDGMLFNDDGIEQDIYSFNHSTIGSAISETQHLGFQIKDIKVAEIVDKVDSLIKNSFVMERMDDKEATIIVRFYRTLRMLQSFIEHHGNDLFAKTDIYIDGFYIERFEEGVFGFGQFDLYVVPETRENECYSPLLASSMLKENDACNLKNVYVVNPDYYIIFGDLIVSVVGCIVEWKKEAKHISYIDFEAASVNVL